MDALTVLRREHTRIAQLFVEFDALSECACAGRRAIMREIDQLVRRHIDMENALFDRQTADTPEEHQLVLGFLDEIERTDCRDAAYVARVHVLRDVLLHQMQDEEAYIFPAYAGTHAA